MINASVLPQPIRSESLANQVFNILKKAVFSGKFQPGETLRELHIARMLEVSQATVREALAQLEQAGLVVRHPNRKTVVTVFTQDEVRDRLTLRVALEEIAFVKAAPLMKQDDVDQLAAIGNEIDTCIDENNCLEMTLADMRFHRFVWEHTGSPVILKTLDQLTTPLFAFLGVLHTTGMHDLRSGRPHEDLVNALRNGGEETIRQAIREHIRASYQTFLESGAPSLDMLVKPAPQPASLRRE
ncbi:MAG: GntR family transcriptional regulator [Acidobacteria bacterium]|nr:GntR family transcriptional regulator [Acidobacteriota bacterium]